MKTSSAPHRLALRWNWSTACLGATLLFSLVLWLRPFSNAALQTFSSGGQLMAAVAASTACLLLLGHAAVPKSRALWGWRFIGGSLLCLALGQIAHPLARVMPQAALLSPLRPDFWWLAQQPLLWSGLLLLTWSLSPRGLARLLVDNVIIVLSALILAWLFFLEPRLSSSAMTPLKTLSLIYVLADLGQLFCALMLFASARGRLGLERAAAHLLGGVLSFGAAHATAAYLVLHGAPRAGFLIGAANVWACALIGLAALSFRADARRVDEARPAVNGERRLEANLLQMAARRLPPATGSTLLRWHRLAIIWLPFAATGIVSGVVISREWRSGHTTFIKQVLPVLMLLLAIVVRQMLTLLDNMHLAQSLRAANAQLQSANAGLEDNVNDRTRHLTTLYGITSTLNTSLDRNTVLRIALEEIITAVRAASGGVWLCRSAGDDAADGKRVRDWSLVHAQGFDGDDAPRDILRDLAIAAAEDSDDAIAFSATTRHALQAGNVPAASNLILVPIRWQNSLLGTLGLGRNEGVFGYEDRALVESVALDAGTALQNARLYHEARRNADRDSVTDLLNHRVMQEHLNKIGLTQRNE